MTTEQAPPPEQSIREKAYHLWEQHGRPSGRDLEFWNRAAAMLATVKPSTVKRDKPAAAQSSAAKSSAAKSPAAKSPAAKSSAAKSPAEKPTPPRRTKSAA